MNHQASLKDFFNHCYEALLNGDYTIRSLKKNAVSPSKGKLDQAQAIEEVTNFFLCLAAKKIKDKRFNKLYDYVLIPEVPEKIKKIIRDASYLDIMNFISPGSEGFPQVTGPKE